MKNAQCSVSLYTGTSQTPLIPSNNLVQIYIQEWLSSTPAQIVKGFEKVVPITHAGINSDL